MYDMAKNGLNGIRILFILSAQHSLSRPPTSVIGKKQCRIDNRFALRLRITTLLRFCLSRQLGGRLKLCWADNINHILVTFKM